MFTSNKISQKNGRIINIYENKILYVKNNKKNNNKPTNNKNEMNEKLKQVLLEKLIEKLK